MQPTPLPIFAFHNCLDASKCCLLASKCCLFASLPRPLVFAWLMTLPLAKQIAWQTGVPKAVCQASCLCTSNIKGNLLLHRQNHRQLACAQAEPKAACLGTGKITRQSRRQSICRKLMPYTHSFYFRKWAIEFIFWKEHGWLWL